MESAALAVGALKNIKRCNIEAAVLSPAKTHLAVCCEFKTLLGLRTNQLGAIYDLTENAVAGRVVVGRRGDRGWLERQA